MKQQPSEEYRKEMVEYQIKRRGLSNTLLLNAFQKIPREIFTSPDTPLSVSYGDFPLPIGFQQTISQPYIVAYMIDLMCCGKGSRILEIGTGSGYQTAILAKMGMDVVSLEILPVLASMASRVLRDLELYESVKIIVADGHKGWEKTAPYDGIIVSAAPSELPEKLIDQLVEGGKLVIPVGLWSQRIKVITKRENEVFDIKNDIAVRFVPLLKERENRL